MLRYLWESRDCTLRHGESYDFGLLSEFLRGLTATLVQDVPFERGLILFFQHDGTWRHVDRHVTEYFNPCYFNFWTDLFRFTSVPCEVASCQASWLLLSWGTCGVWFKTKTADKRTVASSDGVGITPYWEVMKLSGMQQSLFWDEQKCAQRRAGLTFNSVQCNVLTVYVLCLCCLVLCETIFSCFTGG
jgi:hypothetical protein